MSTFCPRQLHVSSCCNFPEYQTASFLVHPNFSPIFTAPCHIWLSVCLPLSLSSPAFQCALLAYISVHFSQSVCLSVICLFFFLFLLLGLYCSLCLSFSLPHFRGLSIYLPVCLSLSVCLSVSLSRPPLPPLPPVFPHPVNLRLWC